MFKLDSIVKGFGNFFVTVRKNWGMLLLVALVGFVGGGILYKLPARMTAILAICIYLLFNAMFQVKKPTMKIVLGFSVIYVAMGTLNIIWSGGAFFPIITTIFTAVFFVAVGVLTYSRRRISGSKKYK